MTYLLFDTDENVRDALVRRLKSEGQTGARVVLVKPGERYEALGPSTFTVRPSSEDDHRSLLAALEGGQSAPRRIVHLWSGAHPFEEGRALDRKLELGIYSLFHLSRALVKSKPSEPVHLQVVYWAPEGETQPHHAAVSAFAKTVRMESPKLVYRVVQLKGGGRSKAAGVEEVSAIILREFTMPAGQVEVRYDDGKRFSKQLQELVPGEGGAQAEEPAMPLTLREGGVYIVTGGLGALGAIFAEHLFQRVRAKLVLVGRSEPTSEQQTRLRDLEAQGAEVAYMRADVSKRDDVVALIEGVRARFAAVHGVFHGAGLTRDALLVKKNVEDMASVLAPKVFGTVHLDEATRDEPLECFVLFSSIAALIGNLGQCDYAYANAFMDNFAEWREALRSAGKRAGRTLSINWPLWADGGMRVDAETERMMAQALGIQPLRTAVGLDALAFGLSQPHSQLLVIEGDRDKSARVLGVADASKPKASQPAPADAAPATTPKEPSTAARRPSREKDKDPLLARLEADLVRGLTEILKVNEADVDLDADMSDFGFDSITFTTFGNDINKTFRIDITPVVFFEHATIRSLSQHLCEEYRDQLTAHYGARAPEKSPPAPDGAPPAAARQAAAPVEIRQKARLLAPSGPPVSVDDDARATPRRAEPIAIIGMSGVMPQSEDLDAFWRHLASGDDLVTEIPSDRWDWRSCFGDPFLEVNKTNVRWGGFIPEVDKFDAQFFGISPREAELMDPQQRILLELVWKAIEDAGYKVSELAVGRVGLFAGVGGIDYHDLMVQQDIDIQAHSVTGTMHSVLVNRISYLLNFRGPSEPVETACSSTLVAIHRAVEAIRSGDCELAVAGGVHVMLGPGVHIGLSKAGMLCVDGRCKTFDRSANGYVRGEGAGAVLMKPLSRAEADGDHIYGVVRGTAVNHGGKVNTLTTPNPNAQTEVIVTAMERAGVDPSTVTYIETHGTGTALGDPIEINGLKRAFKQLYKAWDLPAAPAPHCGLGSVKTNIGHLEFVSGLAGVLKVLLSLQHKVIPPTIHIKELNPYIQIDGSPFYIAREPTPWRALRDHEGRALPRRAGVSSFGFGGVNGHVVIEEYVQPERAPEEDASRPALVVLSAKNEERLRQYAGRLAGFLRRPQEEPAPAPQAASEPELALAATRKDVVRCIADVLRVGEADIDGIDDLHAYCDDAFQLKELSRSLHERCGVALDLARLRACATVYDVAAYAHEAREATAEPAAEPPSAVSEGAGARHSLGEIAYTLQVGREEMDERLAIEASSTEELLAKLTDFAESGSLASGCHRGSAKEAKSRDSLCDGEEGQEFLQSLVRNQRLSKLGRLWVSGVEIPWRLLYGDAVPMRIPLPTYPFAREHHWLPTSKASAGRGAVHGVNGVNGVGAAYAPFAAGAGQSGDIAIVGIAGRYPMAATLEEYWANLAAGRDCVTEIPRSRWDHAPYYAPDRQRRDKVYTRWGGFLDDVDKFDPLFFNISPREAEIMDPQERLFLETAWHALEDAAYTPEALGGDGREVGVFVGVMYGEYQLHGVAETLKGRLVAASSSYASIANRVSFAFDFRGPSMAVDTMCSSSLTSIHLACEAIRDGSCKAAIAGGVNLSLHVNKYILLSQTGFAASDGRCRSFGAGGDGYVPGEGVGAVVLKPLARALEDGDHIHAVIKATAVNHDGRTPSYTSPNPDAHREVILAALARAGIAPETIGYIEAHGTGTPVGDPTEIAGLTRAFEAYALRPRSVPIGSVKSCIGHLEGAAGIAAVTKAVLQMRHGMLAPSIHAEPLNPELALEGGPFYVQRELAHWARPTAEDGTPGRRRAAINSFGAGGSNAHLILEEPEERAPSERAEDVPCLFVFSAPSETRLRAYIERMVGALTEDTRVRAAPLADIAYTLQVGRRAFAARLAIVAASRDELLKALLTVVASPDPERDGAGLAQARHGGVFTGWVAPQRPQSAPSSTDGASGDLEQIGRAWARGVAIPWRDLHRGARRRKVPLPGVVFEKRRCWITAPSGENGTARRAPLALNGENGTAEHEVTSANRSSDSIMREILELLRTNKITEAQARVLLDS